MDDIFEEFREQDDLRDIEEIQDIEAEEAIEVPANDDADGANVEEEESKRVQPKVRKVSRPRQKLDAPRLTGPRGLGAIMSAFENIKFKGKGYELDDLTNVLTRLQHWAHRLYPNFSFEDCIDKIEELGSKKPVFRAMESLRLGAADGSVVHHEDEEEPASESIVEDPFDKLLPTKIPPQPTTLTEEQKARMLKNRLLAEERRMARIKAANEKPLTET
ncbi:TIMELESS-interacting protein [Cimex lectularius]|uniref:TIMELESS-interacting protein n=1 Tax=Cimex lectularius TaxID=79782 RepID=A0A8I6TD58_CIMLE|nr:TIMELESS-interacting protein [Cimex lectularius]